MEIDWFWILSIAMIGMGGFLLLSKGKPASIALPATQDQPVKFTSRVQAIEHAEALMQWFENDGNMIGKEAVRQAIASIYAEKPPKTEVA